MIFILVCACSRPFCQNAGPQSVATTFNVNLFPSTSLMGGITVNFVDYEGENGSDFPIMAAVSSPAWFSQLFVSQSKLSVKLWLSTGAYGSSCHSANAPQSCN